MSWLNWCCFLTGTLLLLVIAIGGPVYAFTVASCVYTRPCQFGLQLYTAGATCAEGGGRRSEEMLHGEKCSVLCNNQALNPTSPELVCLDGDVHGSEDTNASALACLPPVFYDSRPLSGGLVTGAVVNGEFLTVCVRATQLSCQARLGGTSVLVLFDGITDERCRELFQECQSLNPEFEYMQHTKDPKQPDEWIPGTPMIGTCTLGCFEEILAEEDLLLITFPERKREEDELFAGVNEARTPCSEGTMCIDVSGSCNEEDNGDYYRYPTCASGFTQWVTVDEQHRLRFDGTPAFSQGGKWLLERGADPNEDMYGLQMGRQPTFMFTPEMGDRSWSMRCRTQVDVLTLQEDFKYVTLNLGPCNCTDEQDCSGHGRAIGSKDEGPNCRCLCDEGRKGDNCEIRLCKVPYVMNARAPACWEGAWLDPGQVCQPMCDHGYRPTYPSFTCGLDGIWPPELIFLCERMLGATGDAGSANLLSTPKPACSDMDCSFRGTAAGWRYDNGTCSCNCYPEYTGIDCRGWVGRCQAPLPTIIDNGYQQPCKEGYVIEGSHCNAQCKTGYIPVPTRLECRGEHLVPPVFRCFGGNPIREAWCEAMQNMSIAMSSLAAAALLGMVVCFGRTPGRKVESYFNGDQLVEVDADKEGKYNVVRCQETTLASKLPKKIRPEFVSPGWSPDPERKLAALQSPTSGSQIGDGSPLRRLANSAAPASPKFPPTTPAPALPAAVPEVCDGEEPIRGSYRSSTADSSRRPSLEAPGELVEGEDPYEGEEGVVALRSESAATTSSQPVPSGRFQPGQTVVLTSLMGHAALNGVQACLVEFDERVGLWVVELEGLEDELKHVPERNLQEIQLSTQEAAYSRTEWNFQMLALEEKAEAARREQEQKASTLRGAAKAAAKRQSAAALEDTGQDHEKALTLMHEAFAAGDIDKLRAGAVLGRQVLSKILHAPASERAHLARVLETAESRLEQHEERESARESKRRADERVLRGEAPDWKMTSDQFWRHAEAGEVLRIRGGLRAKQPLSTRDGKRRTVMHAACRRAVADAQAGVVEVANRLATVESLVEAKANPNAVDVEDLTPLDLALAEGGDAARSEVAAALMDKFRALGLRTTAEALRELREAATVAEEGGGGS